MRIIPKKHLKLMSALNLSLGLVCLIVLLFNPSGSLASTASANSAAASGDAAPLGPYTLFLPLTKQPDQPLCHFGIGAGADLGTYDVSIIGAGSLIDWYADLQPGIPPKIEHLPVINVGDGSFQGILSRLPQLLADQPHATWLIGNEPDSGVDYQDHITAESYAERYFAYAQIIRSVDATAKIGFGTIIEPSPVRMYYLDRTLNRLAQLAGSMQAALNLIDVYTVHFFIMNESGGWGAGVPLGYDPKTWPAPVVIHIGDGIDERWKTHDMSIFKNWVISVRQWMKKYGEKDKPLWITEYGNWLPYSADTITESMQQSIDFMNQSYDFMLGYKDPNLGYALDGNRLVQRWVWYSLKDALSNFGGSLYDPSIHNLTPVGKNFMDYDPPRSIAPLIPNDVLIEPGGLVVKAVKKTDGQPGRLDYLVSVDAVNGVSTDYKTGAKIVLYIDDVLIGSTQAGLQRCSGRTSFKVSLPGLKPGVTHTFSAHVELAAGYGVDTDPINNDFTFPPVILPGDLPIISNVYLPITRK